MFGGVMVLVDRPEVIILVRQAMVAVLGESRTR